MDERDRLEKAINAVEAQRATLGDEAVDAVLAGLRQNLADIEAAGERRVVTALFCDVAGSTALAEKLDPETWAEIMNQAFEHLTEPVDRFGGMVSQLQGDAVLAFFGAPVAHEDDPERAVRAGLAIHENLLPFREALQRDRGLDFNVRVGINTGLVVAGKIGTELHEEYAALGEAVNLATRMEKTARPGTVQVSEHTYKLVATKFEFEEVGAISIEGDRAQVTGFRVLGHRAGAGSARGLASYGIASPLVGRDAEFAIALAAVDRLMTGQGGILSIIGEAGIGKSRLVDELQRYCEGQQLTWLSGHTLSYGQSISYRPFQDILRKFSGIQQGDNESEAWDKLQTAIRALFRDEEREILPYLAVLMTVEPKGDYAERVRYLDGEAMWDQILAASRRFFERLAAQQPLVLVFEDLHWMDASSVRLLEHLLPLSERAHLLFCGVSRPNLDPAAAQLRPVAMADHAEHYTEIRLSPLSGADSAQLVGNLLEIDNLSVRTREMIVQKADGNPFFLEEIIRHLIEQGAVIQDTTSRRWRATEQVETISIPDTIQGVLTARIDRLDEGVKRVLRAAAVIGRSFQIRVLTAVLEAERALDRQLAILQTAELISVKRRVPELEYVFRHALAQEATYQSILHQTRRGIHARVGRAIESLNAGRLEEFYSLLAYHYAQAEEWELAQDYLLRAGDQAGQVAADAEAVAHYRQALEAYENAFGPGWDPLQRATLARKMGEATYGLGQLNESRQYFLNSLALLDKPLPPSNSGLLLGLMSQIGRQVLHRLWPSRFVARAPAVKRETYREAVRAYERLGVIYYIEGEAAPSIYAFLRSLNLAEPAGPGPELARAYANNVVAAGLIPPLRFMADQYSRLALETARDGDDLAALAWVWQLVGIYNMGIGRFSAALDAEQQAAEINQRIGRLRWWAESAGTLAQALHFQGNFAGSQALYLEIHTASRERTDRQSKVWALAGLVETGLRLGGPGHTDELLDMLEQARAHLSEYRYPNRPDEIQILGALALVRLRRQEWEQARQAADEAAALIAQDWPPSTFYTFEGYAGLPAVYLELWQAQMQGQYSGSSGPESLEKLAARSCRSLHGFARIFPIAKPRAWLWQGTTYWLANKRGKAQKAWRKSLDQARRLEMPYDQGLAHFEIGRHSPPGSGERETHLQQAIELFTQLGAAWDVDLAQRAQLTADSG